MLSLLEFVNSPNDKTAFAVALDYELLGQSAASACYYLKAAELSLDRDLIYTALLKASQEYLRQGSRNITAKTLLQQAICVNPARPEAHFFLSQLYEKAKDWQNSYLHACLGLQCDSNIPLSISVSYPGEYALLFQKAVSGYWWGKGAESRQIFQLLIDSYWNSLDSNYRSLVEFNVTRLGVGPESSAFTYFKPTMAKKLKCNFKGLESIDKNYSQAFQDIFVLGMLQGKTDGTFLEIGASDPFKGSNTALLERLGWKGVAVEVSEKHSNAFKASRSATLLTMNALHLDYSAIIKDYFDSDIVDYLQIDIEPAKNSYTCLQKIPFDSVKFRVITFEHDYYVDVTRSYRELSRQLLLSKGYKLVLGDISVDGKHSFEDWWVHPDLVDPIVLSKVLSNNLINKIPDCLMLNEKEHIEHIYSEYDAKYGSIWGFCSLDKAGCFIDYTNAICSTFENPVCVEVGVYGGKSALPVAITLAKHDKGKLYAIDPWSSEEATKGYEGDHYSFWSGVDLEKIFSIFKSALEELSLTHVTKILRCTSDAAPDIPEIHFLHIDGQHTEQAIKDAKKFATAVVSGGYCVVDDYDWGEVSQVPDYLYSVGFSLIHRVDKALVFLKN